MNKEGYNPKPKGKKRPDKPTPAPPPKRDNKVAFLTVVDGDQNDYQELMKALCRATINLPYTIVLTPKKINSVDIEKVIGDIVDKRILTNGNIHEKLFHRGDLTPKRTDI